ncbi:MAG: leucine-rich repeat protein [Candidatus Lokiarchaeota archaeon]
MKILQEFRVNKFISLKLEKGRWNEKGEEDEYEEESYRIQIYVNDEPFRLCKYLLLINPHLKEHQWQINSIDEAKELLRDDLDLKLTPKDLGITPEEEFWAHCSNLQVWVEHDYDPRLIDTHLAFPILIKLKDLGDITAQKQYNQVIIDRYVRGTEKSREMLREFGYLNSLTREEVLSLIEDPEDLDALLELQEVLKEEIYFEAKEEAYRRSYTFDIANGKIISLRLSFPANYGEGIPRCFGNFPNLEKLILSIRDKTIRSIPDSIGNLSTLRHLRLVNFLIKTLPETLGKLKNLEFLDIYKTQLSELPQSIGNLSNLKKIRIQECSNLETLPESFGNLESLNEIEIRNSGLKCLPESFGNLLCEKIIIDTCNLERLPEKFGNMRYLKHLRLKNNKLEALPESFGKLHNLEQLDICSNIIRSLPESFGDLKNLKVLDVLNNSIAYLPKSFKELFDLNSVNLDGNNFEKFPDSLLYLENLKFIGLSSNKIKEIPREIGNLKNLETLILSYNPLFTLPSSISEMDSIRNIYVKDTNIT